MAVEKRLIDPLKHDEKAGRAPRFPNVLQSCENAQHGTTRLASENHTKNKTARLRKEKKEMTKQQKHRVLASAVLILTFGVAQNVNAMHIMEGYLPGGFCIAWGVICLPFLWMGFRSFRKALN